MIFNSDTIRCEASGPASDGLQTNAHHGRRKFRLYPDLSTWPTGSSPNAINCEASESQIHQPLNQATRQVTTRQPPPSTTYTMTNILSQFSFLHLVHSHNPAFPIQSIARQALPKNTQTHAVARKSRGGVAWSTGPLVHWSTGPLVHWSTGPLEKSLVLVQILGNFVGSSMKKFSG
jgi:hypothetical protein